MPPAAAPSVPPVAWRRARGLLLLGLAVLAVHALLGQWLVARFDAAQAARDAPARLQAVFVRELQQAAPPAPTVAAAPPAPPRRRAARPAAPPASVPEPVVAEAAPEPVPEPVLAASEPASDAAAPLAAASAADGAADAEPSAADAALAAGSAAASATDPALAAAPATAPASAAGFEWPPSTRLSYTLTGSVRGEVYGTAQVEWLREGARYQVHLDVVVGTPFPLMERRMRSDGDLTAAGLVPRRYDESTRVAFGRRREASVVFAADTVTLANGRSVATLPSVQDTASQFVQLSYLFLTGAERLRAGARIEVPLALPRRVDVWVYEVVGEERLDTPFGTVAAWHLKPTRAGDASALSIEAWFAPSLQYLPVRIVIRQGAEDHLDLMIDKLPQQAEVPTAAASAASGP